MICAWFDSDFDSGPGLTCNELATHYSCNAPGGDINVCQKHKCRCGSSKTAHDFTRAFSRAAEAAIAEHHAAGRSVTVWRNGGLYELEASEMSDNPNIPCYCNACGRMLRLENLFVDDGCPCNSRRGVNFEPKPCTSCQTDNCVKPGHRMSELWGTQVSQGAK